MAISKATRVKRLEKTLEKVDPRELALINPNTLIAALGVTSPAATAVVNALVSLHGTRTQEGVGDYVWQYHSDLFKNKSAVYSQLTFYKPFVDVFLRLRTTILTPGGSDLFTPAPECLPIKNTGRQVFIDQTKFGRAVLLSDIHFPYYDKNFLQLMLQKAREEGCDSIIINGDFLDLPDCSKYVRNRHTSATLEMEIYRGVEFIQQMRAYLAEGLGKTADDIAVVYKEGNHEQRYTRSLASLGADIQDMDTSSLATAMRLDDHGIDWSSSMHPLVHGDLHIYHGHELKMNSSNYANVARILFNRTLTNSIAGHLHVNSMFTTRSHTGKEYRCWSVGTCGQLDPEFHVANNWNYGAMIIDFMDKGKWNVQPYELRNGVISK